MYMYDRISMNSFQNERCKLKHTLCVQYFFFAKNHAICVKIWENMVQPDRPQMTWHMHAACCITKATDTHLEYAKVLLSRATMVT